MKLSVTRSELMTSALPWPEAGNPDYAYQLHSHPGNFTVSVLNYGERQPGAETIDLRLSRPIGGRDCFHTTNGIALFSSSGTRLLLHDLFWAIVIETQHMAAWHYQLPGRTLFSRLGWEGENVTGTIFDYRQQPSATKPFGPWSPATIAKEWQLGLDKKLWES